MWYSAFEDVGLIEKEKTTIKNVNTKKSQTTVRSTYLLTVELIIITITITLLGKMNLKEEEYDYQSLSLLFYLKLKYVVYLTKKKSITNHRMIKISSGIIPVLL